MQHKLLGSTALVSAGLLMSGAALAQETTRIGGIEVSLGGYTEWGVKAATEDTLTNSSDNRNYLFFMDNEVFINATATTSGGVTYGSRIELEAASGDGNVSDATIDEVYLFFSGNFGRVELGRADGASDVMGIGAADAQAGTGGIDGDTTNLVQFQSLNDGDSNKATYFTPRLAGFQLGGSFTPDSGNGINDSSPPNTADAQENIVSLGANWVGALGPVDLTVAGTGSVGKSVGDVDDLGTWDAGFLLGFGGLSAGVQVFQNTDFQEAKGISGGIKYGFGAANVSAGYAYFDPDDDDVNDGESTNLFAVSGDVGILPGVTLKGDVTYNTDDAGADDSGGTDNTLAGVATIQLDY
jgi:hypothetical protein